VYSRNSMKTPLIAMREIPTPSTASPKDGGLVKFGGAPLGFAASGTLERSVPGGKAVIVTE